MLGMIEGEYLDYSVRGCCWRICPDVSGPGIGLEDW